MPVRDHGGGAVEQGAERAVDERVQPRGEGGVLPGGEGVAQVFQQRCGSSPGAWVGGNPGLLVGRGDGPVQHRAFVRGQLGTDFLTCNFDMIQHYRAVTNVVQRPPKEGRSVIAMHEIVLPLLHQAILTTAEARGCLREPR